MDPTSDIIEVVTEPAGEPVTAQELYDHLKLNCGLSAVEDQLEQFITAARQQFEFSTDGRIVLATTFRQHLTEWPKIIRLQRGKVTSVTEVTYHDQDDQEQELDDYLTDLTGVPALVYVPNQDYPQVSTDKLRPISVEFVAGWPNAEAVPADVKLAILLLAGHWYERREAYAEVNLSEVPMGFQRVANKYRTGLIGF